MDFKDSPALQNTTFTGSLGIGGLPDEGQDAEMYLTFGVGMQAQQGNLLGLHMIVKNEYAQLCESGKLSDWCRNFSQIVVVDTGSTDGTYEYLKELEREIVANGGPDFTVLQWIEDTTDYWTNDFAAARNLALSAMTTHCAMWLDADDIVDADTFKRYKQAANRLIAKPKEGPIPVGLLTPYHYRVSDSGEVEYSQLRERLFYLDSGLGKWEWQGTIHETCIFDPVHNEDIAGILPRYTINLITQSKSFAITHKPGENDSIDRNIEMLLRQRYSIELGNSVPALLKNAFYLSNEYACKRDWESVLLIDALHLELLGKGAGLESAKFVSRMAINSHYAAMARFQKTGQGYWKKFAIQRLEFAVNCYAISNEAKGLLLLIAVEDNNQELFNKYIGQLQSAPHATESEVHTQYYGSFRHGVVVLNKLVNFSGDLNQMGQALEILCGAMEKHISLDPITLRSISMMQEFLNHNDIGVAYIDHDYLEFLKFTDVNLVTEFARTLHAVTTRHNLFKGVLTSKSPLAAQFARKTYFKFMGPADKVYDSYDARIGSQLDEEYVQDYEDFTNMRYARAGKEPTPIGVRTVLMEYFADETDALDAPLIGYCTDESSVVDQTGELNIVSLERSIVGLPQGRVTADIINSHGLDETRLDSMEFLQMIAMSHKGSSEIQLQLVRKEASEEARIITPSALAQAMIAVYPDHKDMQMLSGSLRRISELVIRDNMVFDGPLSCEILRMPDSQPEYIPSANPHTTQEVTFIAPGAQQWDGMTPYKEGIGASESSLVYLAEEFARRGISVTVYTGTPEPVKVVRGVRYVALERMREDQLSGHVIVSRMAQMLPLIRKNNPRKASMQLTFWAHDVMEAYDAEALNCADNIVCVSEWQARNEKRNNLYITPNLLSPLFKYFKRPEGPREIAIEATMTSQPERWMGDPMLNSILNHRPLVVTYGYDNYLNFHNRSGPAIAEVNKWRKFIRDRDNTVNWGRVSNGDIFRLLCASRRHLCLGTFPETFCVSAVEAALLGLHVTHNGQGAIPEILRKIGVSENMHYNTSTREGIAFVDQDVNSGPLPVVKYDYLVATAMDTWGKILRGEAYGV